MNSIRIARTALRVSKIAAPAARRGYADVAPDKIRLSLALPHQVCRAMDWWRWKMMVQYTKADGGDGVYTVAKNDNADFCCVRQSIYKSQDV